MSNCHPQSVRCAQQHHLCANLWHIHMLDLMLTTASGMLQVYQSIPQLLCLQAARVPL
jgi:hypothetical protein